MLAAPSLGLSSPADAFGHLCVHHVPLTEVKMDRMSFCWSKYNQMIGIQFITFLLYAVTTLVALGSNEEPVSSFAVNCSRLMKGQYSCPLPVIDSVTQQPIGCRKDNTAPILCTLNTGLICMNGTNGLNQSKTVNESSIASNQFISSTPCLWTNGYSFETSLLLSIFLGMFGADRFYLGYPGIGLLKFCTLGFLFFGQLVDIVLIAMQVVKPADGSEYVMKYFGPRLNILSTDNNTYHLPYDEL